MSHRRLPPIAALAALLAVPALADPLPREGAYAVEVRLGLPHLEDMTQTAVREVCLGAGRGLRVLSDSHPLSRCPVSDVREEAGVLTFAIACEGRNAARATARYVLTPERVQGRITMQMGGKNMTMTEVQSGRRTGTCAAGEKPGL